MTSATSSSSTTSSLGTADAAFSPPTPSTALALASKPPLHRTTLSLDGRRVTISKSSHGALAETGALLTANVKEDLVLHKMQDRIGSFSRQRLLKTIDTFKAIYHKQFPIGQMVARAGAGPGSDAAMTSEQHFFKRDDIQSMMQLFASSAPDVAIFTYFRKFVKLLEGNWDSYPLLHQVKAEPQDQAWDFLLRVFQYMTSSQLSTWDAYLKKEQMKELKTLIQESTTDEQLLENARNSLKTSVELDVFQEMRVRILTWRTGSRAGALNTVAMDVLEAHFAVFDDKLNKHMNDVVQGFLLQRRVTQIAKFKEDQMKVHAFQQTLISDPNDILCPVYY